MLRKNHTLNLHITSHVVELQGPCSVQRICLLKALDPLLTVGWHPHRSMPVAQLLPQVCDVQPPQPPTTPSPGGARRGVFENEEDSNSVGFGCLDGRQCRLPLRWFPKLAPSRFTVWNHHGRPDRYGRTSGCRNSRPGTPGSACHGSCHGARSSATVHSSTHGLLSTPRTVLPATHAVLSATRPLLSSVPAHAMRPVPKRVHAGRLHGRSDHR